MSRPACANPANIRHVVKPSTGGGSFCFQECVCGEIVSNLGECRAPEHGPHYGDCTCEVTPVACLECDTEFMPVDPDDDICAACIALMRADAAVIVDDDLDDEAPDEDRAPGGT